MRTLHRELVSSSTRQLPVPAALNAQYPTLPFFTGQTGSRQRLPVWMLSYFDLLVHRATAKGHRFHRKKLCPKAIPCQCRAPYGARRGPVLTLQSSRLPIHVFNDNIMDFTQMRTVFQYFPRHVRMKMNFDQFRISDDHQTVPIKVAEKVRPNLFFIQSFPLNQKLRIILVCQHNQHLPCTMLHLRPLGLVQLHRR